MGVLRLLLAVAVVLSHTRIYGSVYGHLGDAELAVKLFFMISGFLMSLVLNKTAAYRDLRTFYVSRALRLYPAYWIMAGATLAWWLADGGGAMFFRSLNHSAQILLAVSNLIIFGQNLMMFLKPTATGLAFTRNFIWSEPQLWHGLLVPPAWSLSLELTFYLIAPFVLRRFRLVAGLAIGSMLLSLIGFRLGLADGPFSYRIFPFELALFLVGVLVERLLLPHVRRLSWLIRWSPLIAVLLFCLFPHLPGPIFAKTIIYLTVFAGLLPFLAVFNRARRWDDWLGNLSCPLYISHFLPLEIATRVTLNLPHPHRLGLILGLPMVVVATLLVRYGVDAPIERRRERLRGKPAPTDVTFPSRG